MFKICTQIKVKFSKVQRNVTISSCLLFCQSCWITNTNYSITLQCSLNKLHNWSINTSLLTITPYYSIFKETEYKGINTKRIELNSKYMKLYYLLANDTLFNPGSFKLNYIIIRTSEDLKHTCKYIPDYGWLFTSYICKINEILYRVLFLLICLVYSLYLEITRYFKNFFEH